MNNNIAFTHTTCMQSVTGRFIHISLYCRIIMNHLLYYEVQHLATMYFLAIVMKRRHSKEKMRAVMVHRFGGVEQMKVEDNAAVPTPAHNQVSSELEIWIFSISQHRYFHWSSSYWRAIEF